jgi:hypothetical protein
MANCFYFLWIGNILIFSDQNVQEELERWELRFGSDFMPVSGRVLREVTIFQHDKSVRQA